MLGILMRSYRHVIYTKGIDDSRRVSQNLMSHTSLVRALESQGSHSSGTNNGKRHLRHYRCCVGGLGRLGDAGR